MSVFNDVSVIVPTTAELRRFASLQRCIASIRLSSAKRTAVIAVINGSRAAKEVVDWLSQQENTTLIFEPTPSAPNAVRIGRESTRTTYFSTLDDDDEYLPGSTDLKLEALARKPDADFLIANGLNNWNATNERFYSHLSRVPEDPLGTLFEANWLASCNALFRSDRITPDYFHNSHPYAEWTWLAFRLAMKGKKIIVLDEPCFRYNYTPASLSQSVAYREAFLALLDRMLSCSPPQHIRRLIERRLSATLHSESTLLLQEGRHFDAIAAHLRSMLLPGGLRYLTYSRRFFPGWPKT